jgi:hypothetical protein
MYLTFIHNYNINHWGLVSLFLFGSAPCLVFITILSRSCYSSAISSALILIILGYTFVLYTFAVGEESHHEPKLPVVINIMLEANG